MFQKNKGRAITTGIILLIACLVLWLGYTLFGNRADKTLFLTAKTSNGHHQIEEKCGLCHKPFQGVAKDTCLECHEPELKIVRDSHAAKIFLDPRNADQLHAVDATACRTCHAEHSGSRYPGGIAIAPDFCVPCHKDVVNERPTHKDLDFETCGDCHNYHDNTALYEDFLVKHLDEPDTLPDPVIAQRNFLYFYTKRAKHPVRPLTLAENDAPPPVDLEVANDWLSSSHAKAGINCRDCHEKKQQAWVDHPDQSYCEYCHDNQTKGFLAGKHGIRIAQGLSPMTIDRARRKMQPGSIAVTCFSCHPAHKFDTRRAAVESCLACHADQHSLAYKNSEHFRLWQEEQQGDIPKGAGVSCASCHLPRIAKHHLRQKQKEFRMQLLSGPPFFLALERPIQKWHSFKIGNLRENPHTEGKDKKPAKPLKPRLVKVQHNQSANLHPNQKMIREVCQNCHGLSLILDSLADKSAIRNNFSDLPQKHLNSLEMVKQRLRR